MKTIKRLLKYMMLIVLGIIISAFTWLSLPVSDFDYDDTPRASTNYWELKTGSKIAYTHIKSKTDSVKSTIIYLHGGPGGYINDLNINVFEEISESGYDIYLYDQIGCGLSERLKKPKEYTVQRHADDLDEIISITKSNNITLIGQSWGAFLGSYYVAYNPKSVEKLILTSPGGIMPKDTLFYEKYKTNPIEGLTNIDERINRINNEIDKSLTTKETLWLILGKVTASPFIISDKKVDNVFHKLSKGFISGMVCDTTNVSEPKGRPGMYCSMFTNQSFENIPADIRTKMKLFTNPVLILKAECDYLDWQEAYEYTTVFPNVKLKVIKNAGHSIYVENRVDYISEILNFLEKDK